MVVVEAFSLKKFESIPSRRASSRYWYHNSLDTRNTTRSSQDQSCQIFVRACEVRTVGTNRTDFKGSIAICSMMRQRFRIRAVTAKKNKDKSSTNTPRRQSFFLQPAGKQARTFGNNNKQNFSGSSLARRRMETAV